jgi:predicted ATPase
MLTRLKVNGFKNLAETEIRFGPFTCVAGFNGVGKSNMFDAIQFLSRLADDTFLDAASQTRGGEDLRDLFTAGADGTMSFDCDLIVPQKGIDDYHQPAEASQTYLNYRIALRLVESDRGTPRVELESESLAYIPRSDARASLAFPHSKSWRDSVVFTSNRRAPFISMDGTGDERRVRLSTDKMRDQARSKRGGGKPTDYLARIAPRSILSGAKNADEARTAVLTRSEMRSWRVLQLEPSALREADKLQAPSRMDTEGHFLAATLYRLASDGDADRVYADLTNRLAELVGDVRSLRVERDDALRALKLVMTDRAGVELSASSLSDGTLRFIALSVLELDPSATGLMCLEEPENGIHPERMDAMMRLLRDMAVDVREPGSDANPLRQVIVSTHSPVVAARSNPADLVFADHRDAPPSQNGDRRSLVLRPVHGSWRDRGDPAPLSRGELIRYLGSIRPDEDYEASIYGRLKTQLEMFGAGE